MHLLCQPPIATPYLLKKHGGCTGDNSPNCCRRIMLLFNANMHICKARAVFRAWSSEAELLMT